MKHRQTQSLLRRGTVRSNADWIASHGSRDDAVGTTATKLAVTVLMSSYGRSIVHIVAEGAAARHALTVLAARRGHRPLAHASLREYLDNCAPGQPGCLVLDVCLSQTGGVQLRDVRRSQVPVVMITPPDDVFTAVQAIKDGAFHVMERQPCEHELLAWIEAALAKDIDNRRARGSRGVAARRVIDAS